MWYREEISAYYTERKQVQLQRTQNQMTILFTTYQCVGSLARAHKVTKIPKRAKSTTTTTMT